MSFVDNQTLLNRLLDATRECQTQYTVKGEIMTERNSCVSCLCHQFEEVFSHGIKQKHVVSGIATIQNVTGLQLVDQETVFWHLIQKHLSKHEVERFNNLYHITSDKGKGRAWLRSALNEHSLDRLFQMILADPMVLGSFYSANAFLLDDEKASLLPQIAGGLKTVMFSIKIDDPSLDNQFSGSNQSNKRSDAGGSVLPLPSLTRVTGILGHEVAMEGFPEAALPTTSVSPSKSDRSHKKKKKKAKTKIIVFGQNGASSTERVSPVSCSEPQGSSPTSQSIVPLSKSRMPKRSPSSPEKYESLFSLSSTSKPSEKVDSNLEQPIKIRGDHSEKSMVLDRECLIKGSYTGIDELNPRFPDTNDDLCSLPPGASKSTSHPMLEEDPEYAIADSLNSGHIESYDDNGIGDKLESSLQLEFGSASDLSSLNDYTTDCDRKPITVMSQSDYMGSMDTENKLLQNAIVPVSDSVSIATSNGSLPDEPYLEDRSMRDGADFPQAGDLSNLVTKEDNNSKNTDLQKALVVLLQRKDELVDENKVLKELLESEKQHSKSLQEDINRLKSQVNNMEQATEIGTKKQLRENDVLRSQLKKYVGAVHALQHGKVPGVSQEGIPGMEDQNAEAAEKEQTEVKLYEQKLMEVTEMHGELMEFTESLNTRFLSALALIHKMHDELVALRGPMPTDGVIRAIETNKVRDNTAAMPSLSKAIVNIWVPSAFMQGSGPESHHVYQVYICLEDEEWNVYRRYSDFYTLHTTLCKTYPEVQHFGFPPKKGIGNRNSKFVEERRKAFQKYLRLVMHNVFQNNAQLKACPTKETLLHLLPFFSHAGDQYRVIVGKHKK